MEAIAWFRTSPLANSFCQMPGTLQTRFFGENIYSRENCDLYTAPRKKRAAEENNGRIIQRREQNRPPSLIIFWFRVSYLSFRPLNHIVGSAAECSWAFNCTSSSSLPGVEDIVCHVICWFNTRTRTKTKPKKGQNITLTWIVTI